MLWVLWARAHQTTNRNLLKSCRVASHSIVLRYSKRRHSANLLPMTNYIKYGFISIQWAMDQLTGWYWDSNWVCLEQKPQYFVCMRKIKPFINHIFSYRFSFHQTYDTEYEKFCFKSFSIEKDMLMMHFSKTVFFCIWWFYMECKTFDENQENDT